MSKFSKIRSNLAAAFTGAARNIVKPSSIISNSLAVGAEVGLAVAFGLASGWALLPLAAAGMAGGVAYSGIKGAYHALKAANKPSL